MELLSAHINKMCEIICAPSIEWAAVVAALPLFRLFKNWKMIWRLMDFVVTMDELSIIPNKMRAKPLCGGGRTDWISLLEFCDDWISARRNLKRWFHFKLQALWTMNFLYYMCGWNESHSCLLCRVMLDAYVGPFIWALTKMFDSGEGETITITLNLLKRPDYSPHLSQHNSIRRHKFGFLSDRYFYLFSSSRPSPA